MHTLHVRSATVLLCLGLATATGCSNASSPSRPDAKPSGTVPGGRTATTGTDWSVTFTASTTGAADGLDRTADRVRERVRTLGMTGTRVTTGGTSLTVVGPYTAEQLQKLGALGQLRFRPVLAQETADSRTPTPGPSASPAQGRATTGALRADPAGSPWASASGGSDGTSASLLAKYRALDCSAGSTHSESEQDTSPDSSAVACATDRSAGQPPSKYLLGPAILTGSELRSAKAVNDSTNGAGWMVQLDFTAAGAAKFADATARLAQNQSPQNEFAIVVDGGVVSAPFVSQALTDGTAQISGSFTEKGARELAAKLNSGALPTPLRFAEATHVTER
ncbi:protein-export membrane protein SecD [Streptomyces sp. PanSC9]|nr:protein-export membrane protein SecD [Streptomyces sp. PanSC9]